MDNFEKRGKFLLSLRLKYNLKQSELASLIKSSNKTISNWERGVCFPSNPKILIKLSNLFDVSVDEILNGEYKNNNEKKLKTSFEYKLVFFKCYLFKYYLLILFFILFLLLFFVYSFFSYKYNFFYNKTNNSNNNLEHYSKSVNNVNFNTNKLFDMGFIDNGFGYYQFTKDEIYIRYYYKINLLKLFYYEDENNILILSSKLIDNYIYIESFNKNDYNDILLITENIKNCDVENCVDYNDYAMYINYLKLILKE